MATNDNIVGLALQITADPSQAEAGLDQLNAKVKMSTDQYAAFADKWRERVDAARAAVAQVGEEEGSTAQVAESAAASAQQMAAAWQGTADSELESLGLVKDAWMQNAAAARESQTQAEASGWTESAALEKIQASASAIAAEEEVATARGADLAAASETIGVRIRTAADDAGAMGGGIYESLEGMRRFRMIFAATVGLASFGFWVNEWGRIVGYLGDALTKMEGIHTAQNDIVMSGAFQALKQITQEEQKQLLSPQNARVAQLYQQGIEARIKTLQQLQGEVAALQRGAIPAQQYAKALEDIAAKSREFGLQGSYASVAQQIEKQIEAYRALSAVEQEYEQKHAKTTKAVKEHAAALDKGARTQERWDEAIATAQVHLPPFVSEVERLQKAFLLPEGKQNNTLFAYAELNAQRLNDGLQPLAATLKQLGISTPNLSMPAVPPGMMNQQLNAVQQLTAAERLMLPTERELQLANQELAREYPNLTAAERAEWAQVMLTSDAYRKHIDSARQVHTSNAQLAASFSALATQVRTAFSQMAGELAGWGGVATRVFDQVFNAVTRQIEVEQRQAGSAQLSAAATAKATIDGFKQMAPVKALIDTAKGIEQVAAALDPFDFNHAQHLASAAQYFAGAALWGTVGAFQIASMAGAFSGSGSKGATSSAATSAATASATPPALAAGAAGAKAASQGPQQTWQIVFNGPVYGGPSGVKEIVNKINGEVQFNRLRLVASHTITGSVIR